PFRGRLVLRPPRVRAEEGRREPVRCDVLHPGGVRRHPTSQDGRGGLDHRLRSWDRGRWRRAVFGPFGGRACTGPSGVYGVAPDCADPRFPDAGTGRAGGMVRGVAVLLPFGSTLAA